MTHTWKVYDLERNISNGMVIKATYGCISEESGINNRRIGEIQFTTGSVTDPEFVSYDNLTQELVLGWITGSIDTSIFETANSSSIAASIVELAARTTEQGTPW